MFLHLLTHLSKQATYPQSDFQSRWGLNSLGDLSAVKPATPETKNNDRSHGSTDRTVIPHYRRCLSSLLQLAILIPKSTLLYGGKIDQAKNERSCITRSVEAIAISVTRHFGCAGTPGRLSKRIVQMAHAVVFV